MIFVTARDEHAVEAFERHAPDYLLKPFSRPRFATVFARRKDDHHRDGRHRLGLQSLVARHPGLREQIALGVEVENDSGTTFITFYDVDLFAKESPSGCRFADHSAFHGSFLPVGAPKRCSPDRKPEAETVR